MTEVEKARRKAEYQRQYRFKNRAKIKGYKKDWQELYRASLLPEKIGFRLPCETLPDTINIIYFAELMP